MARTSLAVSIVVILKNYGQVPVDFLAQALNRTQSEILDALISLEHEGVKIRREDDMVALDMVAPARLKA